MRQMLLALTIMLTSALVSGLPYHAPDFRVLLQETGHGETIDLARLNTLTQHFARWAGQYPPSLDSDADRQQILADMTRYRKILTDLSERIAPVGEPAHLWVMLERARLAVIEHNLDIDGAAVFADQTYKAILPDLEASIRPDVEIEYGRFLVFSHHEKEAVPYLENALTAGRVQANKLLAIAAMLQNDKTGAKAYLAAYQKAFPDDPETEQVARILDAAMAYQQLKHEERKDE